MLRTTKPNGWSPSPMSAVLLLALFLGGCGGGGDAPGAGADSPKVGADTVRAGQATATASTTGVGSRDPERRTPPLSDITGQDVEIEAASDSQRQRYLAVLRFGTDSQDIDDEMVKQCHHCPDSTKARLLIRRELGTHLVNADHFKEGGRIVAQVELIPGGAPAHEGLALLGQKEYAYLWVSSSVPNSKGQKPSKCKFRGVTGAWFESRYVRITPTGSVIPLKWPDEARGCVNVTKDKRQHSGRSASDSTRKMTWGWPPSGQVPLHLSSWFSCAEGCCQFENPP